MTTIEISTSPLPQIPAPHDEWREYRPTFLSAYTAVLNAERHANEQLEADPSNREAKENRTFARVAGYFLLELFNRRTILSEMPCVSLVKQLISRPQDGGTVHDVVFRVGKWHFDYLVPMCAFRLVPFVIGSASQFPCSSYVHQELPNAFFTPFAPLL